MFLVNLFSWCKLLVQKHLNPIGQYLFTLFPFFMAHKSQNSATSRQKGQEGQEVKEHFLFKYGQKETLKKSVKAAYSIKVYLSKVSSMDKERIIRAFLKYPKCFGRLGRWTE